MKFDIIIKVCLKSALCLMTLLLLSGNLLAQAWNIQSSPTYGLTSTENQWARIVWADSAPNGSGGVGLFAAVAGTGGVMTSPDGFSWTVQTAPVNEWTSIVWSPALHLFVAVAASGVGNSVITSPDGVTWTSRTASVNGWWLSVTWSPQLNIFVAVGYPGLGYEVMTSADGITWTGRTAAAANDWNAVTWAATAPNGLGGHGLFVAVAQSGTGNRIMTSPDGINWTSRISPSDDGWNDITWSPTAPNGHGGTGLFVSVNADGAWYRVMTSPDGIIWTHNTIAVPSNYWYAVVWADSLPNGSGGYGLFVSTGYSNGYGHEIMTSTDGINWISRTNTADANWAMNYVGLAYSTPLGLLVALDYTTNTNMTSTDAITWTDHADPVCASATDAAWESVTWGATAPDGAGGHGLFVAVALSGNITDQVMTSPDGVTWTARTAAAANDWKSVAWSPSLNLFAAVAQTGSGNRVMTSPDGITWTSRTSAADNNWQSLIWADGPGLFVAVSNTGSGNCVMTSADGITWTSRTTPGPGINLNSVAWAPSLNLFVAVGDTGAGNRVMTSPDGISWALGTSAADNQWRCVTWGATAPNGIGGQGLFVAVSQTGTGNRVMTSPDGITWTARTSAADYTWQSVTWSPELGLFAAVASSGTIYANPAIDNFVMVSPDGITWTGKPDAINNFWSSLVWSPKLGIFAAVAYSSANPYSSINIGDFIMTSVPVAPVIAITNISADSSSATISWTTNEEGSSQILYGLTSGYGMSTSTDTTLTFNHSMTLTGLSHGSLYHFQVKSALTGLSSSSPDSTFITICGPCIPSVITGPGTVCNGASVTLTDSLPGGRWSSSSPCAKVDSITGIVTGMSAGISTISYTIAGNTVTKSVTVNPGISASGAGVICAGNNITLTASGGSSYSWSPATGLSVATGTTVVASPAISTIYTVTGTSTYGCSISAVVSVTVNPLPATSAGSGTSICNGISCGLTATGGTTYTWTPSATLSASTGAFVTANPTITTTYTVTGTTLGCSIPATVTVTVNISPLISAGSGTSVCIGNSTLLFAAGGTIYSWSPSSGLSATSGISVLASPTTTTTYTLTAVGCSNTASVTVTVNNVPAVSSISGTSGACIGSTTTFTDATPGGVWSTSSPVANAGSSTGVVNAVAAGTANISYTVTNAYGCSSTVFVPFTVMGIPYYIYNATGLGTNVTSGDGGLATLASIQGPRALGSDTAGNIYICDVTASRIRKIGLNGVITTVAGNGTAGITGDGGPATAAALYMTGGGGVCTDRAGNLYISNTAAQTIRKVNASTGIINTICGLTTAGYSGDGGPASAARLQGPAGICTDTAGNLYIADAGNYRIRRIDAASGLITTIAGNGSSSFSGDGGPGVTAALGLPKDITADQFGNLYITDNSNNRIRKYVLSTGIITTVAGNGASGSSGDGGPATDAKLNAPVRCAVDGANNLYIADGSNNKVRKVNLSTGIITTSIFNGISGNTGDGGPATAGEISGPAGIAINSKGDIYIADGSTNRRVRVSPNNAAIYITLAGTASVSPGTALNFSAHSSVKTNITYQWNLNGSPVSGATNSTYFDGSPVNGNVYTCTLTLSPFCGAGYSVTSNSITVSVASVDTSVHPARSWRIQASPTYSLTGSVNEWAHVVWADNAPNGSGGTGLFAAVAGTGGVMTSPDGYTWTVQTAPVNEWTSIDWSPSLHLFVAVAASGVGNSVMTSPDGVAWTSRSASVNGWWLSVIWCPQLSLFVSVGYPGLGYEVMTSTDGISWTGRSAAAPNNWNAVTWAATVPNGSGGYGLFVAVAQSGIGNRVMTSPDGVNWTSRLSSSDAGWNDITWSAAAPNGLGGNGLFVAVNADGAGLKTMTSPDGVNWIGHGSSVPYDYWYSVVWADSLANGSGGYGLFVVTGYSDGSGNEIMTSPDGINWTMRNNAADANWNMNYVGLAYSRRLGLLASLDYTTNTNMTSSNGITWTDHADPACPAATDGAWQCVAWGAGAPNGSGGQGLYVAVALSGSINDQVMTSSDGVNWTARTAAAANDWTSVAWSPSLGLFAAVAQTGTGNRVMTSADGITWVSRTSPADNKWQSITWAQGLGLFVAVASNGSGNSVMTSPDGISWTCRTTPVPGINLNSVTWAPVLNLLVAVGDTGTGNRVLTSTDGINWTLRTSAADNDWRCVTWGTTAPNGTGGQGLFVAVAQSGSGNRVMTSPDGFSWTARTSPADYTWQSVSWSPELGIFVAVASSGTVYANPGISNFIMTSPDGITWTGIPDAINNFWTSVAWSPKLGIFAAVAYSSVNVYSSSNIGDFIMTSVPVAPVITITNVTADSNSATISWTTNEAGNGQILYGLSTGYGMATVTDTILKFNHTTTITGLTCGTNYHFQVKSALAGLSSSSPDSVFHTSFGSCAPPAINGPGNVCVGSGITLTDSLPGGRWSGSSLSASVDSVTGVVAGISAGVTTITYTVGGHAVTRSVTVNPGISAGTGVALCRGSSTVLSATGGSSYSWIPSYGLSGTTGTGIVASPTISTTYTVTGISAFGCGNTALISLTVNPLPTVIPGSGVAICFGNSATLSVSGGASYSWSPSLGLSTTTGTSVNASPSISAIYTITGTASGCTNTGYLPVTVNPVPSVTAISGPGGACLGSTATFTDGTGGGVWTSSSSAATVGSSTGLVTAVGFGTANISYSITNSYGCSSAVSVPFMVQGTPHFLYTAAGLGTNITSGDGGPAILAGIQGPRALAADTAGNIYISDVTANRIRKIAVNGIITTVAGNGSAGNTGDGGPATAAPLNMSGGGGVCVDRAGNIYISNTAGQTIRKVNTSTGIINTICGTTVGGYSGDGGPASAAKLLGPTGICTDTSGNLYITDGGNFRVRRIDAVTGIITTIIGTGSNAFSGDGGPGTAARVSVPRDVTADLFGNLYITDNGNNRIRKYVLSTGIITTIAGTGTAGSAGDGGQATAAQLNSPARSAVDGANNLYIADGSNNKVRMVNLTTGIINTVIFNGTSGNTGDGGPATSGQISGPAGIAINRNGDVYVADGSTNRRIRMSAYNAGVFITLAGPATVVSGAPVTFTANGPGQTFISYQWKVNGSTIAGATSRTYTDGSPASGNVYTCVLTLTPACGSGYSVTSNSITITVAGHRSNDSTGHQITEQTGTANLYPNPVHEILTLVGGNLENGEAVIKIYDELGKVVTTRTAAVTNGQLMVQIDVKLLSDAVYVIRVNDAGGKVVRIRFVKD